MLLGTRPPHSDDQLAKYGRLALEDAKTYVDGINEYTPRRSGRGRGR
ncbi:hypothetical protein [Saccharopolyspora sp. ASAGF58]|nr:hypothetical protein [Saccharopolyspora sp. ASAGF58]